MIDIFLSDLFMGGVICTVLFLLVLVTVVHAFTRRHERTPQQREWRVIEPAEQLPTVTAKRIEVQHGN
jgi:TRAP-type C4-dicarboxylate transport system permease large subunit